jgi:16S rRNA (uracil1498-N3)-methyltransferase
MSQSPRFFIPSLSDRVLSEPESRHAHQVLRLESGATITLFDGQGREGKARITSSQKNEVAFDLLTQMKSPERALNIHLGQAIPKGKSMDLILQKATELGAATISPILADRSVVELDAENREAKKDKWQQTVLEACKQCGQNWMPEVRAASSFSDFLDGLPRTGLRLIASLQPDARPLPHVLREAWTREGPRDVTLLIGPEGDFTPAEIGKARAASFLPVSLGPYILRTETATIFCLSSLLYESLATQR